MSSCWDDGVSPWVQEAEAVATEQGALGGQDSHASDLPEHEPVKERWPRFGVPLPRGLFSLVVNTCWGFLFPNMTQSVHMKHKSLFPKPILGIPGLEKNPLLSCEAGEVLEKIFRKSMFSPRLAVKQGAGRGDRAGWGAPQRSVWTAGIMEHQLSARGWVPKHTLGPVAR